MEKIYKDFFRELVKRKENLPLYVESLYEEKEHSATDLNEIFGILKSEKLVNGYYADNRFQNCVLTFKGKHFFDGEDKPHLIELLELSDNVEKHFHPIGYGSQADLEMISDTQAFLDWSQEVQLDLQLLYEKTEDQFVWETLDLVKNRFGGYEERKVFSILISKLTAISKRKDYFFQEVNNVKTGDFVTTKKPLIFISHASENKRQVELLVNLLISIGLRPKKHIFCSSIPGCDIPVDEKIRDYLKNLFRDYALHVFFILSSEYYESHFSLNEMGAAWVLETRHTSILLPGFSPSEMDGVIKNDTVSITLEHDEEEVSDKLDQLRNALIEEFNIEITSESIWREARDKFIQEINLVPTKLAKPLDTKNTPNDSKETVDFLTKISETSNASVYISRSFASDHSIEIGNETIATEYPDRREYAKWEEIIDNCVKAGYLKRSSENLYVLTNSGYKIIGK